MTKEQQYINQIRKFLEKNFNGKPREYFNYADNKNIIQDDYFVINFEETGPVIIHPSIDDFYKPYKYTCFIRFEEEKGAKYFYLNGRKWNIHAINTIKEIEEMLALRFNGLTVSK